MYICVCTHVYIHAIYMYTHVYTCIHRSFRDYSGVIPGSSLECWWDQPRNKSNPEMAWVGFPRQGRREEEMKGSLDRTVSKQPVSQRVGGVLKLQDLLILRERNVLSL